LFLKLINNIYFIYLIPIEIKFYRFLHLLSLKKFFLKIFRKKLINSIELKNINYNYDDIKLDYSNEKLFYINSNFRYYIGKKFQNITLSQIIINKKDYIFPYLFWYFNWLHNDLKIKKKELCKLFNFNHSLSNSPHPLSNRIINLLLRRNFIISFLGIKKLNIYLFNSFKSLMIDTEENVYGNHLIDNYIALIYLSKYFDNKTIEIFFDKKLKIFLNKKYFKENNISYCRLLLNKINSLKTILGSTDNIDLLKEKIEDTYPFIYDKIVPYYNDTYFQPSVFNQDNYTEKLLSNKKFLYYKYKKDSWFFLLLDGSSDLGFNGHDHDNSPSIQLVDKSIRLITNCGTFSYEDNKLRIKNKSRKSGGVFYNNYSAKIFLGNFRILNNFKSSVYLKNDINGINYLFNNSKFSINFNFKRTSKKFQLSVDLCKKTEFNFFSEIKDFSYIDNVFKLKNYKIIGVRSKPKVNKSYISNGLYNNTNGYEFILQIKKSIIIEVNTV